MNSLKSKLKPNRLTKAICLALAIITFTMSLWCVSIIGKGAMTFGKDAYLHNHTSNMEFTESDAFENAIFGDLNAVSHLAEHDKQAKDKNFKNYQYQLKDNDAVFKYYVESVDGTVFTNLKSKPSAEDLKTHRVFLVKNDKKEIHNGSPFLRFMRGIPKGASVRLYLNDELFQDTTMKTETVSLMGMSFEQNDYIAAKAMFGKMQNKPFAMMLALAIVCFIVSIALLIAFLLMVGRTETEDGEEKKIAFIDRVPGDLHAIGSLALFLEFANLGYEGLGMTISDVSFWSAAGVAPVATGIGGFLVLTEFLASVCRSVKSGYGFWKHTLIGRLVLRFVRKCKYIAKYGVSALQNIKNDPKQLKAGTIILALQYLLVNLILLYALCHLLMAPGMVLVLIIFFLFNSAVLTRFIRQFGNTEESLPEELLPIED